MLLYKHLLPQCRHLIIFLGLQYFFHFAPSIRLTTECVTFPFSLSGRVDEYDVSWVWALQSAEANEVELQQGLLVDRPTDPGCHSMRPRILSQGHKRVSGDFPRVSNQTEHTEGRNGEATLPGGSLFLSWPPCML